MTCYHNSMTAQSNNSMHTIIKCLFIYWFGMISACGECLLGNSKYPEMKGCGVAGLTGTTDYK